MSNYLWQECGNNKLGTQDKRDLCAAVLQRQKPLVSLYLFFLTGQEAVNVFSVFSFSFHNQIIIIIINDNFYSALSKSSKALYNQDKKVKNTN